MPLSEPTDELDGLADLLPSNGTKLERDILKVLPYDSVLQEIASQLDYSLGSTVIPNDWKLWVLQERGQLPLLEAIGDIDLVLENSLYLAENRGTLAAVIRVCRMLGYNYPSVWEQEWPSIQFSEFHVNLGEHIASQDSLERVERAIKAVKPLRCRLRRLYNGNNYDVRRLVPSKLKGIQNGYLGRQVLGHFSGWPSAHNPDLWTCFVEDNIVGLGLGLVVGAITFPYTALVEPVLDSDELPVLDSDGEPILSEYTS